MKNIDAALTSIFTDGDGFVRAASSVLANTFLGSGENHYKLKDGTIFTMHIYGDQSGKSSTGIFLPTSFDRVTYVGGKENSIVATNTATNETLRISHVDVKSQRELNNNLGMGKTNAIGSRYIANSGGPGGNVPGNVHSHVTFFASPTAMGRAMAAKYASKNLSASQTTADYTSNERRYLRDVRSMIRIQVCKGSLRGVY